MDASGRVRAAQYVRMSTEDQRYSPTAQRALIEEYAQARGYLLVRRYADEGVSGLSLNKRAGLKALLADVLEGRADFSVILVCDVSRWGRYQDLDQGAHYEFLCRAAGVRVEYCAEPFENDGSMVSAMVKSLKRAMAAEYSRELGEKVRRSQRGLGALGYWQGGPAPYGLRRQAVAPGGERRSVLEFGQQKAIRGDRIILVPGPPEEVAVVRRIFRQKAQGESFPAIARGLNRDGVPKPRCELWRTRAIERIVGNEAYVGAYVTGKALHKLGQRSELPRSGWIRKRGAFEPIVTRALFERARKPRCKYHRPGVSDHQLLEDLAELLRRKGYLSRALIKAERQMHCPQTYLKRFGSLAKAYQLVGYDPPPLDAREWRRREYRRTPRRRGVELHPERNARLRRRRARIAQLTPGAAPEPSAAAAVEGGRPISEGIPGSSR